MNLVSDLLLHFLDGLERLVRCGEHLVGDGQYPLPCAFACVRRCRRVDDAIANDMHRQLVAGMQLELLPNLLRDWDRKLAFLNRDFRHAAGSYRHPRSIAHWTWS